MPDRKGLHILKIVVLLYMRLGSYFYSGIDMSKKSKRVFISVDMEGITSIVSPEQTGRDPKEYEVGRKLMVGDVNAAIEGILAAGGEEVVVCDGHGGMKNIQPEDLHEDAILVRGSPKLFSQMEGISSEFDAAMFVGYHAKMGTRNGIICHTYYSIAVSSLHINGIEVGETGLNAALAGYNGVPLVFISGDNAVAEEARGLIPNITTAVVKWGVGREAAKCMHPRKARELIKSKANEAMRNAREIKPFIFKPPIEVRLKLLSTVMADACECLPYLNRLDGTTLEAVYSSYPVAHKATTAAMDLAASVAKR